MPHCLERGPKTASDGLQDRLRRPPLRAKPPASPPDRPPSGAFTSAMVRLPLRWCVYLCDGAFTSADYVPHFSGADAPDRAEKPTNSRQKSFRPPVREPRDFFAARPSTCPLLGARDTGRMPPQGPSDCAPSPDFRGVLRPPAAGTIAAAPSGKMRDKLSRRIGVQCVAFPELALRRARDEKKRGGPAFFPP